MASISNIPEQSANDAPTPQLAISDDNDDYITTAAYLPDGRIVTGSKSGAVRVWNSQSGEQEGTSMEHENETSGLVVTLDGAKIISGDIDGQIKVWDVESHKLVKTWTHPEFYPVVAISPDDRLVTVGGWTVGIYTTEGERVNSIKVSEYSWSLSFSPDGNKLACGAGNDIFIYDVKSGTRVLGPFKGHDDYINCVLWSCNGTRLFSASSDKTIRCWNTGTGEQIGQPWTGHTGCISSLSLAPDGTLLASASLDNTVRFWDTIHGRSARQHLQHNRPVRSVRFSPSGEFVASGDEDGSIYLGQVPQPNSMQHHVITPFMHCIFLLIFIVSQVTPAFSDVRHSGFRSHTPLILCVALMRVPSRNRTCTPRSCFACEHFLNGAII